MKKPKKGVRVKPFTERVIQLLQRQGWDVKDAPRSSPVDITATRANGAKRAFIVKAHGHITRAEMGALQGYQETNHVGIVYIHASSESEILFCRMDKHLSRGGR